MVVLLAGRAAEEVVYDEISTGAADDLAKATDIARQSVTRFGMSTALGPAVLEDEKQQWLGDGARFQPRDYADATAREVDLAVRGMLEEAAAAARDLLHARIDDLRAGARMLIERETITPDDFRAAPANVSGRDQAAGQRSRSGFFIEFLTWAISPWETCLSSRRKTARAPSSGSISMGRRQRPPRRGQ
jgi:hypothetical protein